MLKATVPTVSRGSLHALRVQLTVVPALMRSGRVVGHPL